MFQGNWTCSSCGGAITELPFEPRGTAGLMCRDCHTKSRADRASSGEQSGERPKVEGSWTCSSCGGTITSLPFTLRDTSNLLCIDCYKQKKAV